MQIARIKETCIYVTDLNATKDFYHTKLSMEVISMVEGRHIFFRAGESVLLCFIASSTENEKELPPHGAYGKIHFAFEVNKNNYDGCVKEITAKNISILHHHSWNNGLRSFYFEDPDKNLVEIIEEGLWEKF